MKFIVSGKFKKIHKKYFKKYPFLKKDVVELLDNFTKDQGVSMGANFYKVRVSSEKFPYGKSKSFRLILYLYVEADIVTPTNLYFKGDRDSISKSEIKMVAEQVWEELGLY